MGLQTGQAIIFAPSGLGVKNVVAFPGAWDGSSASSAHASGVVTPFGQGYLLVRSRQRITRDGGHSLLAVTKKSEVGAQTTVEAANHLTVRSTSDPSGTSAPPHHHLLPHLSASVENSGKEEEFDASDSGFETCAEEDEEVDQVKEVQEEKKEMIDVPPVASVNPQPAEHSGKSAHQVACRDIGLMIL